MNSLLPTVPLDAETGNPTLLMLYSTPKAGKTTILAGLPNCLIVDLEQGAKFVKSLRVDGSDLTKLRAIIAALNEGHSYDYIAIDPITRLEDIVLPLAVEMLMSTPIGKSFDPTKERILDLPKGAGYYWLRLAFEKVIGAFRYAAPTLILSGHLREKMLEKGGKEVAFAEIDLTGKLRSIMSSHADAIGLLYRSQNQGILSFVRQGEEVISGARPLHLRDKEFVISEMQPDGSVKTYWERIFLPEKKAKKG